MLQKEIDNKIFCYYPFSSSSQDINSTAQNSFNSQQHQSAIYISRPLSKQISNVIANSSRKRNIEKLKIENQNNSK